MNVSDQVDRRRMALSAAALHISGGSLVIATAVLLQRDNAGSVQATGAVAIVAGIGLIAGKDRLNQWAFHLAPALGSVLIGILLHLDRGDDPVAYGALYTFVALYVFYWFERRVALAHLALVAASCGVALSTAESETAGLANFVMYCGAATVTGVLVGWLATQIRASARLDGLTGLANRQAWEADLLREAARNRRDGGPFCVVIVDLDDFKEVNDRGGHAAGDRRLKEVAAAWASEVRGFDTLSRWGGDEFAILLPDCEPAVASEIVERLRDVAPDGQGFSAGIARFRDDEDLDSLVHRADAALYEAKRAGGGRTVISAGIPDPVSRTPGHDRPL